MFESLFQRPGDHANGANSANMIQSSGLKQSIPLGSSLDRGSKGSKTLRPDERSKVEIDVENSVVASEPEDVSSRYASNVYGEATAPKESLMNPAVILPLKKSQLEFSLRSSAIDNKLESQNILPSMKMMQKRASDLTGTLNGIRGTQMEDDWIG
jgi:hypothetical protein